MGREVRRVPANWQHPKEIVIRFGREEEDFVPLLDGYNQSLAEWLEGKEKWAEGLRSDYRGGWEPIDEEHRELSWEEWDGERPNPEHYMPDFPVEERTHWQMYQNTSEGTPISPVMETPEELACWLADNNASAFADRTATYEQWLNMIGYGSAPSAIISGGQVSSGVAAMPAFPAVEVEDPETEDQEDDEVVDQDSLTDTAQRLFEMPQPKGVESMPGFVDAIPGVQFARIENFGHPWTREPGWDLLELRAATEEDLTKLIAGYEAAFWQVWIRDNTGHVGAVLYQPSGASAPWEDPICKKVD